MGKLRKQPRRLVGKRDPNFRKGYVDSFPKGFYRHVEAYGRKSPKK